MCCANLYQLLVAPHHVFCYNFCFLVGKKKRQRSLSVARVCVLCRVIVCFLWAGRLFVGLLATRGEGRACVPMCVSPSVFVMVCSESL